MKSKAYPPLWGDDWDIGDGWDWDNPFTERRDTEFERELAARVGDKVDYIRKLVQRQLKRKPRETRELLENYYTDHEGELKTLWEGIQAI